MPQIKIKLLLVGDSEAFTQMMNMVFMADSFVEIIGSAGIKSADEQINRLKPDAVAVDFNSLISSVGGLASDYISGLAVPALNVYSGKLDETIRERFSGDVTVKCPKSNTQACVTAFAAELKVKLMNLVMMPSIAGGTIQINQEPKKEKPAPSFTPFDPGEKIIVALGASTGGTDALEKVIRCFPENFCPVLVVQHMPAGFTQMYADRLHKSCKMMVKEAKDGDRLRQGLCLIGAGNYHLELESDAGGYFVKCRHGEKVSGHCPSVDVLFHSVSEKAKHGVVAAILTGMGADGADGLCSIKNAGGYTIGQNKESCVVYGMPMVAFEKGGCCEQAHIDDIGGIIVKKVQSMTAKLNLK